MTCPRCGTEYSDSSTSCPACSAAAPDDGATLVHTPAPGERAEFVIDAEQTLAPPSPLDAGQTLPPPPFDPDVTLLGEPADADMTLAAPPRQATTRSGNRAGAGSRATGATGPLAVGQTFGTRYHIIKVLGVGGMGAVYQAWDAELGEAVAIKVIRPEAMENPGAALELEKRFKRELLLARQVTHKNVVRIHDLGEIDGIKYITMSYVEGTELASMLREEGKLSVERTLVIIRSIVEGLLAAHAAGIVHRDLKPANIMIREDGEALIMDFGIARSTSGPSEKAVAASVASLPARLRNAATNYTEATIAGSIVGTVQYMAPEQARGEEVDQRTDIYALGLIVYDMLAGRHRSEHAESAIQELRTRMERSPVPIQTIVPSVPGPLNEFVSRCIEVDRDKRFASTQDMAAALARLDEHGNLRRIRRVVGLPLLAAVVLLLLLGSGGIVYYQRQLIPEAPHDPVSVVLADIENRTGDPTFDNTLEPQIKRALEGAGFITAYDRTGISRTLGVKPPEKLDENVAREVAVKQGLGVVVSGAIAPAGNGYEVSIKATRTVSGDVITAARARAGSRDRVLETANRLVTNVRQALGDKASESEQMFAMASLSATSLEVVRYYGQAMEAQSKNDFEQARENFLKTVELDPRFGIGYQGLSVISRNLGRLDDADKYIKQALQYLDGMTERERFVTRGMYYRVSGDYEQCVKEYGELVSRYAGDAVGHNQRALCLSKLRDLKGATEDMRQVVQLLPRRAVFRDNLALYANYASDFQTAEKEALAVEEPDAYAVLALAFAQFGQGRVQEATATYTRLAGMGRLGATMSASGLADIALYEGRLSDAIQGFEAGAAADLAAKNGDKAAMKLTSVAYANLLMGRPRPAAAAAERALAHSKAVAIQFLAGRTFVAAGVTERARELSAGLSQGLQSEPQAYATIIEGELALKAGNAREAVKAFTEANNLLDTWLGHYDLGLAYLALEAYPQADSEFDRCIKRKGEALSLFVDEEPTLGYFPGVYYYQGRVREGLNSAGFADLYREYLNIRGTSTEDPLLPDIRRRLAN